MVRRFAAVVLTAALLGGCTKVATESASSSAGGPAQRHSWTQPDTLRVGIAVEPNTLNPILAANTTESFVGRLSFDVLVSADAKGNPVPVLAAEVPTVDNGGISKDGLTITYKLRKNVKWHDGVPFTSKDVKYSYEQIINKANNVISATGYLVVQSCQTPDDATVVFHLKRKFAPAINTIFGESDDPYAIIPEHLLAKYNDVNKVPFNSAPIGTGPYKVAAWVRGDHIEYVPNDDYFLGKPKLKKIIVKIVPDENTGVNQMRTHELDYWFEATPNTYKDFKVMADVKNVLVQQNQYYGMYFNMAHAILKDVRVRKAIAYAIDRKSLVENFTYGSAQVATEDLPSSMWAYNPNVAKYEYSPEKAKALLQEAGFAPGPDGIMRKGNDRLDLTLTYNTSSATGKVVSVQVQGMLKQIGINVDIKSYLPALLFAQFQQGGILTTGKYDIDLSGWIAGVDPDDSSQYMCKYVPPAGNNYMRYCNPALDAAENAALENYDQPTRKKAYDKIQQLLADDMPQFFIWWPRQDQPINPDFQGFDPNPVNEAWNAYQWSI